MPILEAALSWNGLEANAASRVTECTAAVTLPSHSRRRSLRFYGPHRIAGKCKYTAKTARTNLGGAHVRHGIFFVVVPLHYFRSTRTISLFGERFRDGQYSLTSFLFAVILLTVAPYPAICNSAGGGGTCRSPVPYGVGAGDRIGRNQNANIPLLSARQTQPSAGKNIDRTAENRGLNHIPVGQKTIQFV